MFIDGLNSPFGMALIDNNFYVANSDAVVRFPYIEGEIRITQPGINMKRMNPVDNGKLWLIKTGKVHVNRIKKSP